VPSSERLFSFMHLAVAAFILLWLHYNGLFHYISDYVSDFVKFTVFAIWFGFAVLLKRYYLINYLKRIAPLAVFYIILFIMYLYVNSFLIAFYLLTLRYLFMAYAIFLFYCDDQKKQKLILIVLAIDFLYVGVNTFKQVLVDPMVIRVLATTPENVIRIYGDANYAGVGSFAYAYSILLVALFLMYNMTYGKNYKLLSLIGFSAILYLVYRMQFVIALLLLIVFSIYLITSKVSRAMSARLRLSLYALYILACIFVFMILLLPTLNYIAEMDFISKIISERIYRLYLVLSGYTVMGDSVDVRLINYYESLNTFYLNIFTGDINGEIGRHSSWLDILALFGILLPIPLFAFFYREYCHLATKVKPNVRILIKACYLYFFFLGLLNPVLFSLMFITLFIVVPYCAFLHKEAKEGYYTSNIG